jgi:hypothetical protein
MLNTKITKWKVYQKIIKMLDVIITANQVHLKD